MHRRVSFVLALPLLAAAHAGCSSSDSGAQAAAPRGEPGGILEVDASGIPGPGETGGSGGSGGGGTEPPPPPRTSFPNAELGYSDLSAASLRVVSMRYRDEPSAGDYFREWLLEIANDGPTAACLVQLEVRAKDASDTELAKAYTFVDGQPYAPSSGTLSLGCIPPGKTAGAYDNGFATAPLDLARVVSLVVTILPDSSPNGGPSPAAPEIVSQSIVQDSGPDSWAIDGVAQAKATIYNVELLAYPRDYDGSLIDRVHVYHLETWLSGTTWSFRTDAAESWAKPTGVLESFEFITGMKQIAPNVGGGAAGGAYADALAAASATRARVAENRRRASR